MYLLGLLNKNVVGNNFISLLCLNKLQTKQLFADAFALCEQPEHHSGLTWMC